MRGPIHAPAGENTLDKAPKKMSLPVPLDCPSFLMNTATIKAFNTFYYHAQLEQECP